jgi:hypothetical protein
MMMAQSSFMTVQPKYRTDLVVPISTPTGLMPLPEPNNTWTAFGYSAVRNQMSLGSLSANYSCTCMLDQLMELDNGLNKNNWTADTTYQVE